MECRDRYFMIAANLSFTGEEPQFEVVGKKCLISRKTKTFLRVLNCKLNFSADEEGANPNTESYGAQNGYTVSVLPARGLVELRASYFSHHTSSQVRSHDDNGRTNSSILLLLTFPLCLCLRMTRCSPSTST